MDSIERLRKRVRLKYEWSRARRAALGFSPVFALVLVAAALGGRPSSSLALGALLFLSGAVLLWHGQSIRRAVLPGVAAGTIPLVLALGANRLGHVCTGSGCTSLCVPACVVGGVAAGLVVAAVGLRARQGAGFWMAASVLALLTGAMGCACIGYSGVVGLSLGFAAGVASRSALQRVTT